MTASRAPRTAYPQPIVRRIVPLALLALLLSSGCSPPAVAPETQKSVDAVLRAAESTFRAMKSRDHAAIWNSITARSRAAIVDDTVRAIADSGDTSATAQAVRNDFEKSGPLAREYWKGYRELFDPDLALEGSRWEEVRMWKDRAEIRIVHARAKSPAFLQLFREEGAWKVGLVETFEAR